jgi:hypothetical protein
VAPRRAEEAMIEALLFVAFILSLIAVSQGEPL